MTRYPALIEVLFEKREKLRNNIEIYVNLESAYPEELAKPVRDADEIHLTVMLASG